MPRRWPSSTAGPENDGNQTPRPEGPRGESDFWRGHGSNGSRLSNMGLSTLDFFPDDCPVSTTDWFVGISLTWVLMPREPDYIEFFFVYSDAFGLGPRAPLGRAHSGTICPGNSGTARTSRWDGQSSVRPARGHRLLWIDRLDAGAAELSAMFASTRLARSSTAILFSCASLPRPSRDAVGVPLTLAYGIATSLYDRRGDVRHASGPLVPDRSDNVDRPLGTGERLFGSAAVLRLAVSLAGLSLGLAQP